MQQIAFPLTSNDAYDANEYIESSSNRLAYTTLNNWPISWGVLPYEKVLILQGPESSGKTFLAKKWAKKSGALFIKKTDDFSENILPHNQAFIIDGFDDSWDEEKILHYFNIIHETGKYLLITTTELPIIQLPDLASRLNSVHKVNIAMMDDELMKMLIFKLFSNHSIVINNEVIDYLINKLPREFSKIINFVETVNKFALQNKRRITIPLVKQVLSNTQN